MKKTVIDMAEFRERVKTGKQKPQSAIRLVAPMQEPVVAQEGRTVSFVFSDSSVDRYGDTIDARGWVLDNFKANPVALFGHDANSVENVIGNARNVRVEGNRLIGDIEFMPAETNPNAEVVYQMVKGGYLKTVSVGFQPLEWHLTKDKNRPGGVDFRKQELLEISIVPIPANPNALTQAKAAGFDIERIGLKADAAPLVSKKGMYDVSCLARLLAELGYLQDSSAWEAEYEGDGSEIPQRLADAMNQLGQILVDMTSEEVGELLSDRGAEEPIILHR
jgi:HK97 family phage prohead protease